MKLTDEEQRSATEQEQRDKKIMLERKKRPPNPRLLAPLKVRTE
jgi:hypothetical protein